MPEGKYKVQEPALLQVGHVLFVLFVRKLAGVVFEDSRYGVVRGGVKENDPRDVFPERFGNACYLLGQNPHADAAVTRAETKIYQLALVQPFTSFEEAQSSRMMSVFMASKKKLASVRKPSTKVVLSISRWTSSFVLFCHS